MLSRSLLLGGVFELITVAWLVSYSLAVVRVGAVLRRRRVGQWIGRATGGVLVTLGVRLAFERR